MFKAIDYFDDSWWEFAQTLNVEEVGAALVAQGWRRVERETRFLYRRPEEEECPYGIDLPRPNEQYPVPMIFDAAANYARFKDAPVEDVLFQWKRLRFDRARFRLISDKTKNGTVPLSYVPAFVSGAITALKAAVKDVETPERNQRYYPRVASSNITELGERAEFGQTLVGSYVITLLTPLGAQDEASSFEETQSRVYRKGMEHLIKTLDSAVRYAESDTPDAFLTDMENVAASANLLDAVLETRVEDGAELEISVDWSPLLPPSQGTPARVRIADKHARALEGWARVWNPKKMEEDSQFVGKVITLGGQDRDEKNRPCGSVVFSIFDDEKNFEAEAWLNADDYGKAINAHIYDAPMTFEGRVIKQQRKSRLEGVKNLECVNARKKE